MFLNPTNLKILINCIILLFVLIVTVVVMLKLKFNNPFYKYLFILYIVFWIPVMLVRPYRGTIQSEIDNLIKWAPLMVYGLIGVFARPIMDFFGLYLRNRKLVVQSSVALILISFIPMVIIQTTATNIIQSIGVGIGASIIGTYELLFKEQYGKSKTLLTVSILAIPPLVADFITSPIQSAIVSYAKGPDGYDLSKMSIMWIIGLVFLVVVFVMAFFIKENRQFVGEVLGNTLIEKKDQKINFALICLVGAIVLFVKFGNSGSVGTTHLQQLGIYADMDVSAYEGYLSTVFSVFQLFGTLLFGYLVFKKTANIKIFLIGLSIWITYHLISLFYFNPIFFISIHSLNGFAYGLLYNLLLGYVLSLSFNKKYYTPMGIYQSINAIGITFSNFFTTFISNNIKELNLKDSVFIINSTIIAFLIVSLLLFIYVDKKKKMLN
ncbi:MAG: MFS transporter [Mycoplasmoidaceae bacterium]